MKKFLSIFNILSFLFISYILRIKLPADDYYFDDERKIIESGFKFLTDPFGDIIFTYISVVILSVLIFIILLFLRKVKSSFYIVSTVYNLIIAIPIFNMYNYALAVNPFGFIEYNHLCNYMFPWSFCLFCCMLSGILLLVYTLFLKTKHLFKDDTIRKVKKISLISVSSFLAFYLLNCVYLSFKIKNIANESYETYGKVNKFPDDISDLDFLRMNIRSDYYKDKGKIAYEEKWFSFPISLIILNKAKAWYWYEYKSNKNSTRTDFHFPVVVDLEFKNFRWVITEVITGA